MGYGPVLPSGTLREEEQQDEQEECANASHAGGVPVFRLTGTRGGGLTLGSLAKSICFPIRYVIHLTCLDPWLYVSFMKIHLASRFGNVCVLLVWSFLLVAEV